MNGFYLAALLLSLTGLTLIDARHKLAVFAQPLRSLATLVICVAGFLIWDAIGIGFGIFFIGPSQLLLGIRLAPNLPLEEPVFLLLLCYTILLSYLALARRMRRR